jgi:hypothetical protein
LPPQQSPLLVHVPLAGTHVTVWQIPPMHGFVPQQSADVAHVPPAGWQVECMRHRGMPTLSGWQHNSGVLLQLATPGGSQQLLAKLHDNVAVLQTSPGLEHPPALPHLPTFELPMTQVRLGVKPESGGRPWPQQSDVLLHSSPRGAQPEGRSQMMVPAVAPV